MICPYFFRQRPNTNLFEVELVLTAFDVEKFCRSLLFHEVDEWLVAAEITPQGAIHIDPWHILKSDW